MITGTARTRAQGTAMPDALQFILPADLDTVVVQMIAAYVVSSGVGGFAAGVVVASLWRWATR